MMMADIFIEHLRSPSLGRVSTSLRTEYYRSVSVYIVFLVLLDTGSNLSLTMYLERRDTMYVLRCRCWFVDTSQCREEVGFILRLYSMFGGFGTLRVDMGVRVGRVGWRGLS